MKIYPITWVIALAGVLFLIYILSSIFISPFFMILLFALLAAHWLADYPLQGDWLSKCKKDGPLPIYHIMAHSGIQAFFVMLLTGSPFLGLLEWMVHAITDQVRVSGKISYGIDQAIHIGCKVLWAWIIWYVFMTHGEFPPFIKFMVPALS